MLAFASPRRRSSARHVAHIWHRHRTVGRARAATAEPEEERERVAALGGRFHSPRRSRRHRPLWRAAGAARRPVPRHAMRRPGNGADERRLLGDRKRSSGVARRRDVEDRRLSYLPADRRHDARALSGDRPQDARQSGRRGDRQRRAATRQDGRTRVPDLADRSGPGDASCRTTPHRRRDHGDHPSMACGASSDPQILEGYSSAPFASPSAPGSRSWSRRRRSRHWWPRSRTGPCGCDCRAAARSLIRRPVSFPASSKTDRPISSFTTIPARNGGPIADGSACSSRTRVSGVARDLFAAAIVRFEERGHRVVHHCHDEVTVESPIGALSESGIPRHPAGSPVLGAGTAAQRQSPCRGALSARRRNGQRSRCLRPIPTKRALETAIDVFLEDARDGHRRDRRSGRGRARGRQGLSSTICRTMSRRCSNW